MSVVVCFRKAKRLTQRGQRKGGGESEKAGNLAQRSGGRKEKPRQSRPPKGGRYKFNCKEPAERPSTPPPVGSQDKPALPFEAAPPRLRVNRAVARFTKTGAGYPPMRSRRIKLVEPVVPMGVPATTPMMSPRFTSFSSRRRFSAVAASLSISWTLPMLRGRTPQ